MVQFLKQLLKKKIREKFSRFHSSFFCSNTELFIHENNLKSLNGYLGKYVCKLFGSVPENTPILDLNI